MEEALPNVGIDQPPAGFVITNPEGGPLVHPPERTIVTGKPGARNAGAGRYLEICILCSEQFEPTRVGSRLTFSREPSRRATYMLVGEGYRFAKYRQGAFVSWLTFEEACGVVHKKMTALWRKSNPTPATVPVVIPEPAAAPAPVVAPGPMPPAGAQGAGPAPFPGPGPWYWMPGYNGYFVPAAMPPPGGAGL